MQAKLDQAIQSQLRRRQGQEKPVLRHEAMTTNLNEVSSAGLYPSPLHRSEPSLLSCGVSWQQRLEESPLSSKRKLRIEGTFDQVCLALSSCHTPLRCQPSLSRSSSYSTVARTAPLCLYCISILENYFKKSRQYREKKVCPTLH